MMTFPSVTFLLLTYCLVHINTVKADCPTDRSNLPDVRLRTDLLCGYDKDLRPVASHENNITVTMRMILKYFSHDVHDNKFTIDCWMSLFWKDEHLKWNPGDYSSISTVHLSSTDIWMPDISVYNRREQSGSPGITDATPCIVTKGGQVVCLYPAHYESLCVPDLTRFPFDTQNCTVRFGSWVHSGEEIDIRVPPGGVAVENLVSNGEWALTDTEVIRHPGNYKCCPNFTYPSVNYRFQIKRLSGPHAASVVLPAIGLIIITLTSLWVHVTHDERMHLCYLNLVCEFLYSQNVSWMLPMNGDKVPLILLFARDSLVLSAFTVIFSVLMRKLIDRKNEVPAWISASVAVLTNCRHVPVRIWSDLGVPHPALSQYLKEFGDTLRALEIVHC